MINAWRTQVSCCTVRYGFARRSSFATSEWIIYKLIVVTVTWPYDCVLPCDRNVWTRWSRLGSVDCVSSHACISLAVFSVWLFRLLIHLTSPPVLFFCLLFSLLSIYIPLVWELSDVYNVQLSFVQFLLLDSEGRFWILSHMVCTCFGSSFTAVCEVSGCFPASLTVSSLRLAICSRINLHITTAIRTSTGTGNGSW